MTSYKRLAALPNPLVACVVMGIGFAETATAKSPPSLIRYLETEIAPRLADENLLNAVRAQNSETATYSASEIERLDQAWRQQSGTENAPVIDAVIDNPLAATLRAWRDNSDDLIHEVFVMDLVGLNVAAAAPTSDYWQGDEPEHADAIGNGLYVGPLEFDELVQRYQVEAAIPIHDPETGAIIGALAVGLDPSVMLE